jgi:NAD-dependent deacetylase
LLLYFSSNLAIFRKTNKTIMPKKKLVVLSGAGISAESGIPTFRDAGGLWEGHDVMEVASPQGWKKNPALVLDFYNQRRKAAKQAQPNDAHKIVKRLEDYFAVTVITQNVDDLHEKAGSSHVIHLHGSLFQMRSSLDENLVYDIEGDIHLGDKCPKGSQLRPHIVWFGEAVPLITTASEISIDSDVFIVVGTSLQVYPAAGLIEYLHRDTLKFLVDLNPPSVDYIKNLTIIADKASEGMRKVMEKLMEIFPN